MELRFKGQFNRDLQNYNRNILEEVKHTIFNVKSAESISKINHLKKLKRYKTHYRIKIADDYRIGVVIRKNIVWFVRFGHRNKIYDLFP